MSIGVESVFKSILSHLSSIDDCSYKFVTATYSRPELSGGSPLSSYYCFLSFERFYVRMMSLLLNNYSRKRHLQPLTYAFLDYPAKLFSGNSTPHVHAVMATRHELSLKMDDNAALIEALFRSLGGLNATLLIQPLPGPDDLRRALRYAMRTTREVADTASDQFILLPKAKSEPNYQPERFQK